MTTKIIAAMAMLLLLCVACNNRIKRNSPPYNTSKTTTSNTADSNISVGDKQDVVLENLAYSTEAPAKSKFTPPVILRDEEVTNLNKQGIAETDLGQAIIQSNASNQEFNTEDYSPIVENSFLA